MTMNFKRRSRGSGFGLVEAIIVAGAIALAAAGVYRFYSTVQAKEQSHQESQNALHVTNSTLRAYAAMASFDGISNARLVEEGLLPSGIDVSGDAANPTIGSVFGGVVTVSPVTLDGKTGGGMILNYASVPRRNCAQFVANAAAGHNFRDITVNGQNVLGPNRVLDQARVIEQCASEGESTVSFTVQHSVQAGGSILSPGACVVPASSPETQTVPCPTGYQGSITQTRAATCPPGANLPVWGSWSTTSNTCVQTCVADPSSPQTRTSTPCPTGQYGTITERRVSACATGQTTGAPTWSAWTVVSNTCDTQCVVPADETRSPGCPSGQSGVFTERRSASCPSPTGAPVWGPWVTLTNTCAQNCVLPNPNPETRWVQQSGNCPQGYSGTKYWEVEQARTASCPSSTGTPTYTSWENTGHTRNENMAQCAALCRPEEQLERWVPKEEGCGPGFAGSKHWEARETRTSYCPTGATYPSTSDWVPTGETRNLVNECEAAGCQVQGGTRFGWRQPGNQYECQGMVEADILVPSGESLVVNGAVQVSAGGYSFRAQGRVSYSCQAGALSVNPTAPTCAPAACNVTGSTVANWSSTGTVNPDIACTAPYSSANPTGGGSGSYAVPVGTTFTVRDTSGPVQGTLGMLCAQTQSPTLGQVAAVQETDARVCAGSCATTPAPAPITRSYAGCAAGSYGAWTQSDHYEVSGFPTCWANTTTIWTPAAAPTGACTNCPAPATETQWGTTTDGTCAAGQYGTTDREKEQSRTRSYNCPANTAALPPPTYTAWTDTGNTRVTVNNCATCPAPLVERQWVTSSATATCPAGQAGTIGQEVEQSRTKSYSCPAGTTTLPTPTTTAWTDTGATRNDFNTCAPSNPPCVLAVATSYAWGSGAYSCGAAGYVGNTVAAGTYPHGWSADLYYFRDTSRFTLDGEATVTCNAGTMVVTPGYCKRSSSRGHGVSCDHPSTPIVEPCP